MPLRVVRAGVFSLPQAGADPTAHPHPLLAELGRALTRMPAAGVSMLTGRGCRVPALTLEIPLTDVEDRLSAEVLRTGATLVVADLAKPGRRAALTRRGDAGSFAGVPLRGPAGDVIGALWVSDTRARRLRADQIRLMAALGDNSSGRVAAVSPTGMPAYPPRVDTSSARLERLLQHADAMIYIKNVEGRFILANPALHELIGMAPGSMLGALETDLFQPEVAHEHLGNDRMVLATAQAHTFEERAYHPDGTLHEFISTKFPLPDSDGRPCLVGGISVDVTDRQPASRGLAERQQRLAAAERISQYGTWAYDPGADVLEVSEGLRALLKIPAAQPVSPDLLRSMIDPADRVEIGETDAGGIVRDVRMTRMDGRTRVFELRIEAVERRLSSDGRRLGTFTDVTDSREREREARRSSGRATGLLEAMPDAVIVTNGAGCIEQVNAQAVELFGYRAAELIGHPVEKLIPRAKRRAHLRHRRNYTAAPGPEVMSTGRGIVGRCKDGSTVPVEINLSAIELPTGQAVLASIRDVSAQRAVEDAVRDSEQRFRLAFEEAPIGMALTGLLGAERGRFLRVNRALCEITGYRSEDLVGMSAAALSSSEDRLLNEAGFAQLQAGEAESWQSETRFRHADGHEVWVDVSISIAHGPDGAPAYTVAQIQDISQRKQAEAQLTHQALHDPLTDLPNRALMTNLLASGLARLARSDHQLAVLFLDLDDFKLVNDSLGHDAGDQLLVEVARRLSHSMRGSDTVARLGGDEFVILCDDLDEPGEVELIIARIRCALAEPFALAGRMIPLRASVGVATSTTARTPEALLANADASMYRAKARGRGGTEIADSELQVRATRQLTMQADLMTAICSDQLRLVYQPCFDLASGAMVAAEALVRWEHPDRGLLTPDRFLDVAENSDLMVDLGEWVLSHACAQAAEWERRWAGRAPAIWVNVSSRQLGQQKLTTSVARVLAETGLSPSKLCLELTERELISAAHSTLTDFTGLKALGVRLAIDDFGTGHTGLQYLRDLPVDTLKIDRVFVSGLGHDRTDTALTTGITALAHSLGLTVVGEGVETEDQRERLGAMGCDLGQGFLLARPGSPEIISQALEVTCGTGGSPCTTTPEAAGPLATSSRSPAQESPRAR